MLKNRLKMQIGARIHIPHEIDGVLIILLHYNIPKRYVLKLQPSPAPLTIIMHIHTNSSQEISFLL